MASSPKVAGTKQWDRYAKGIPTDLSDEQRELVAAFLAACSPAQVESMRFPCEPPEYFACRVLRARKFVVEESLKLVETTTAWRAEVGADRLAVADPVDVLGCSEDELQVRAARAVRSALA